MSSCTRSILPPNATPQERALELVDSERLCDLMDKAKQIGDLWNPGTCPASFLPWLAWTLSVDEWDSEWSEAVQRSVCAESIQLHRIKGTPAAVKKALTAMGYSFVELIEFPSDTLDGSWTLDGAKNLNVIGTFEFDVVLNAGGPVSAADENEIRRRVDYYKNARSHLNNLHAYSLHLDGTWDLDNSYNLNGGLL